jgi:ribonuclease HII
MVGVLIEEKKEDELRGIGVKDSKQLTSANREALVKGIKSTIKDYKLIQVLPKEIDAHVLSDDSNLNNLELLKTADIINSLKPDVAYVDSPSNNLEAYTSALKAQLKHDVKLVCAHKADSIYISVGAASILAKVKRDEEIEKLKQKIGMQFGSGYPADPITSAFLKKYYNKFPEIFRKSWVSYTRVVDAKKQGSLKEF